ncbi:MAG: DMT family protein [Armatimonadetes bacterium]|nr:DMT family protein [Armatimonadota bacterium]
MLTVLKTICLLVLSNTFMNAAWYGHLKFKSAPLFLTILASWGLAFFEYCLQVPANRMGSETLSVTQLKVIQELLSITTFALFALFVFKEKPTINHGISFALLVGAAFFAARK